jgi:hypothetical protein
MEKAMFKWFNKKIDEKSSLETGIPLYEDYKDKVSFQSFQQILWGRYYSELPIYKKREKKWINI